MSGLFGLATPQPAGSAEARDHHREEVYLEGQTTPSPSTLPLSLKMIIITIITIIIVHMLIAIYGHNDNHI